MDMTSLINSKIGSTDVYLSLLLTSDGDKEVLSNMPNLYKKVYYQNQYDEIDDTFDYTQKNIGRICYPNRLGDYYSNYIQIMESYGYYNLFSFSVKNSIGAIACIVTVPWAPFDNQQHFKELKNIIIKATHIIIKECSQFPQLSEIELSQLGDPA